MERIDCIYQEKKVRNTTWIFAILKNGKKGIFMNGRLQRIFRDYNEALTIFEIWTSTQKITNYQYTTLELVR